MTGGVCVLADVGQVPGYLTWLAPLIVIGIIVQFFWQSVVSYQLHKLAKQDRTVEGLERRLQDSIEKAANDRHELTTKLVDERFRAMTHDVNGHVQTFTSTLDVLRLKLEKSEEELDGLGEKVSERNHGLEIQLLKAINEVKTHVVERSASKDDLKGHQHDMQRAVEGINGHLRQQDERLARIEQRCEEKPHTGTVRRS